MNHCTLVFDAISRFIGKIIFNQVMSREEVEFSVLNEPEPVYDNVTLLNPTGAVANTHMSVDDVCDWPEDEETRQARRQTSTVRMCPPVPVKSVLQSYAANPDCIDYIAEDASTLACATNLHKCTATCSKYMKTRTHAASQENDCRFGFKDGKLILDRGSVKNGKAVVYCDGTLEIDGKPVDVDEGNGETAALRLRQEVERAAEARKQSTIDGVPLCEDDDDFIIRVRRGSTHLDSYNWILADILEYLHILNGQYILRLSLSYHRSRGWK